MKWIKEHFRDRHKGNRVSGRNLKQRGVKVTLLLKVQEWALRIIKLQLSYHLRGKNTRIWWKNCKRALLVLVYFEEIRCRKVALAKVLHQPVGFTCPRAEM